MQIFKFLLVAIVAQIVLVAAGNAQKKPFVLETEDFKITFKSEAEKSVENVDTEAGPLSMNMHILESNNEADSVYVFMIMNTFYPKEQIHSDKKEMLAQFFDNAINGGVKNVNGKIISTKSLSNNGFPGKEAVVEFALDEATMANIRMIIYLVENQMIMLQTVSTAEATNSKEITDFLASFTIKKKAAAGNPLP